MQLDCSTLRGYVTTTSTYPDEPAVNRRKLRAHTWFILPINQPANELTEKATLRSILEAKCSQPTYQEVLCSYDTSLIIVFRNPQLFDPIMSQLKPVSSSTTYTPDTHFNLFAEYNQQDATFLILFISVRRCTCFRRFFRPSSGAQNCTYSVRHLSDHYCYLLLAWPDSSM